MLLLKGSGCPWDAGGLSSTAAVNAHRHHIRHLSLVETGDKAELAMEKVKAKSHQTAARSRRRRQRDRKLPVKPQPALGCAEGVLLNFRQSVSSRATQTMAQGDG